MCQKYDVQEDIEKINRAIRLQLVIIRARLEQVESDLIKAQVKFRNDIDELEQKTTDMFQSKGHSNLHLVTSERRLNKLNAETLEKD